MVVVFADTYFSARNWAFYTNSSRIKINVWSSDHLPIIPHHGTLMNLKQAITGQFVFSTVNFYAGASCVDDIGDHSPPLRPVNTPRQWVALSPVLLVL